MKPFLSSVAAFEREQSVGGAEPLSITDEYARRTGRDLAANASLYGGDPTYFAAVQLARHITAAMDILQLPKVMEAFAVTDMWQVIERVAQREFGVTVDVVKHRTLAEETHEILNLVAKKHEIWDVSGDHPLFPDSGRDQTCGLSPAETGELFRSVECWLVVSSVQQGPA